ncbi:MAG TPA: ABC transporter substrate-binding protein [Byssovorax sp.]|jgi:hypothetical protein
MKRLVALCVLLFAALSGAPARAADDAARVIQSTVDQAFVVLRDAELKKPENRRARIVKLRAVADRLFDWEGMAQSSLGVTYRSVTADQRREFVTLFKDLTRPDEAFYGIGPNTRESWRSRYTKTGFDASAREEVDFSRGGQVAATLGLRRVSVSPGHYMSDPSLERAAALGYFAVPFGFEHSYVEPYSRLDVQLDSRARGGRTGSGVALRAQSEQGCDLEHTFAHGGQVQSVHLSFGVPRSF